MLLLCPSWVDAMPMLNLTDQTVLEGLAFLLEPSQRAVFGQGGSTIPDVSHASAVVILVLTIQLWRDERAECIVQFVCASGMKVQFYQCPV